MRENKQVVLLNLEDILPNRFQPRIKFNEKSIVELSESIKEHGVIQPIIVRKISDKYEIIAGERRYKASILAGKNDIPAIIVDMNDKDSSEIALIENVQREDLTPIEEAISYRKILDMGYLTQEALASKLGVSQSTIANKLRLLNLDDNVQEALLDGKISERHARALLRLDEKLQPEMLKRIISERLTVRKTDEVIENMLNNNSTNVFDSLNSENLAAINENNQTTISAENNPFIINSSVQVPEKTNVEVLDFGFEEIKAQPMTDLNNEINVNNNQNVEIGEQQYTEEYVEQAPVQQPYAEEYVEQAPVQQPYAGEYVEQAPVQQPYAGEYVEQAPVQQPYAEEYVEPAYENRFITMVSPEEQQSIDVNQSTDVFNQSILSDTNIVVDEEPASIIEDESVSITEEPVNNIFNSMPTYEEAIPKQTYEQPQQVEEIASVQEESPNVAAVAPAPYIVEEIPATEPVEEIVPSSSLKDIINKIRKLADEIENNGYEIDTEEFDFDDIYQVIFKIKK